MRCPDWPMCKEKRFLGIARPEEMLEMSFRGQCAGQSYVECFSFSRKEHICPRVSLGVFLAGPIANLQRPMTVRVAVALPTR